MRNIIQKNGIIISDSGWLRDEQELELIKMTRKRLADFLSETDHHALKKAEGSSYDQTVIDQRQFLRQQQNLLEVNVKKASVTEKDMDMIDFMSPDSWISFNNKYNEAP